MCEYVLATSHSGAHIDALAHMTVGKDDHWFCGAAATHLGDFRPTAGDATAIPPIWTRGALFDVPRYRGVKSLGKGEAVSADELKIIARAAGLELGKGDVALVRTGYLSHWPDQIQLEAHRGAGPDLSAARWFSECGVVACGSDTETFEVQPAPAQDRGRPSNPQPVHTLLLIEKGIYIMESLYLEELARDSVSEFLFVALPVKIRGATGSMMDPIAVIEASILSPRDPVVRFAPTALAVRRPSATSDRMAAIGGVAALVAHAEHETGGLAEYDLQVTRDSSQSPG